MPGTYPAVRASDPLAFAPEDAPRVATSGDRFVLFCNDDDANRLTWRKTNGTDESMHGFVSGVQDVGKGEFRWTQDNGVGSGVTLMRVQPSEANVPPFHVGTHSWDNLSGSRLNQVFSMGWNMGGGGSGPIVPGEPAIGIGLESFYSPDGTTNDYMEYHVYFVTSAGAQRRPWSFIGNRTTGTMAAGMNGESITFCQEAGGVQTCIMDMSVSPATVTWGRWQQLTVVQRNENNNVPVFEQVNAQQNAWLELIRLNGSNEVELGHGGVPTKCAGTFGCNNATPPAKPTVSGSRGANAALASLLTALASYGLITDGTSA